MKMERGTPLIDGLYVVYVPGILGWQGWLEPQIVLRFGGKWRFRNSQEEYPDTVHCWSGPLPVMKKDAGEWDL